MLALEEKHKAVALDRNQLWEQLNREMEVLKKKYADKDAEMGGKLEEIGKQRTTLEQELGQMRADQAALVQAQQMQQQQQQQMQHAPGPLTALEAMQGFLHVVGAMQQALPGQEVLLSQLRDAAVQHLGPFVAANCSEEAPGVPLPVEPVPEQGHQGREAAPAAKRPRAQTEEIEEVEV
eukprot:2725857-Amphidinium_carterae.1